MSFPVTESISKFKSSERPSERPSEGDAKPMEDSVFELLEDFFKTQGTAHIQINSYNDFIFHGLQKIIDEKSDIVIPLKIEGANKKPQRVVFSFGQLFVNHPTIVNEDRTIRKLYPQEARLRDLTYESNVYIDIIARLFEEDVMKEEKVSQRVLLCQIPTMIGSQLCNLYPLTKEDRRAQGECDYDQGGYFIVNGTERVIVAQQRPNYNFVQVLLIPQTSNTKYRYISEIRSVAEESGYSVVVQTMMGLDDRTVFVSLPNIKEAIPAGIVFRALGFSDAKEITSFINMNYDKGKKYIKYILQDSLKVSSKEEALTFIGKHPMYAIPKDKQDAYARQVVEMELFPHLGITAVLKEKASFLGYMINRLICTVIGIRKDDDRDNVSNKRFDSTGMLIQDLFRSVLDNFLKSNIQHLGRRPDLVNLITQGQHITKNIRHCFSTGNWGMRKSNHLKMGVSQVLNRMTYFATLSHLRHIVIPIGKEGKNAKIRQIHTSQIFFICPAETPEGHTSGIVTNFSILTKVSKKIPTVVTKEAIITNSDFLTISLASEQKGTRVLLNGVALGKATDPFGFVEEVVQKREDGLIDKQVSVVYDEIDDEIRMFSDEGRLLRPVFTIKDGKFSPFINLVKTWEEALVKNVIRYIDSNEAEQSFIAMTPDDVNASHHFCEIHPSAILGVCASIIPFPDHSQSPRNCYQSSMAKQALGIPLLNFDHRTDTIMHIMDYPQRPLVSTKIAEFLGYNDMPAGANPIVAIMPKEGYNQEDSVILNKASIERGLFRVTAYFTLSDEESRSNSSNFQTIEIPHPDIRNSKNNYAYLDSNGIIKKGIMVKRDDVIIGKVLTKIGKDGNEEKKDVSVVIKPSEEGIIHNIRVLTTTKGYKMVKITIRVIKTPEVGDKFASRAAQKGTCGMIFSQEDMPFTADGITPDVIINPHCIPSRMTINQLLECILGKSCALKGEFGNATPFSSHSTNVADKLCDKLESYGYERHGLETMFNPYTGEEIDAKIFIGPTYYQRLKHMVSDKMHSRAKGHVTMLTRQPLEGRSRDGGLRFGEMERDAMIVHGNSRFLKERLFDMSDPFCVIVCSLCGMISSSQTECRGCKEDKLCTINLPYAAKLLFQELNAMGIKTALMPKM